MARSSTSSSSEVDEDISPNNVKFETDEAKFSLQPYLFLRLRKAPVPAATVKAEQMKRVRTLRLMKVAWII